MVNSRVDLTTSFNLFSPLMVDHSTDRFYLKEALRRATTRLGSCAPNPSVGAVIVKNGSILGSGVHYACGHDHAEVAAIKAALNHAGANALKAATLYVTLEPCAHHGNTPPCTDAIIRHQLSRVIYAEKDPNSDVIGGGHPILHQAGVECKAVYVEDIARFYQSYRYWCHTKRPWVTVKLALSLDGKIALKNKKPIRMTGPELNAYTHTQRKQADAIFTTERTIRYDDPQLNARDHTPEQGLSCHKKPLYVLDSHLATSTRARIFKTAHPITLFYNDTLTHTTLHAQQYTQASPSVRCIPIKGLPPSSKTGPHSKHWLDLTSALRAMGKDGMHHVWVEAGGHCVQSLLDTGLVQRALFYIVPMWLGASATPAFITPPSHFIGHIDQKSIRSRWFNVGDSAVLDLLFTTHTI